MVPKFTEDKIYELLPSIYRQKDYENNEILKALLKIISREIQLVETNVDKLYDNWFIETCDDWVIPYLGDLVGVTKLNQISGNSLNFRRYVADSVKYRKQKGTLNTLEMICKDSTGWNLKFVEFFKFLTMTQYLNHIRINNICNIDFKTIQPNTIFTNLDNFNHLIDVKTASSGKAYYNIQNMGLFVWRLNSYPIFDAPAFKVGKNQFKFSQLGYDMQLFKNPDDKINLENSDELEGPLPITRLLAGRNLEQYYSDGTSKKSMEIHVNRSRIHSSEIAICDLSKWENISNISKKVAIDPTLGRIFAQGDEINDIQVSYYYGFSSEIGANGLNATIENEEELTAYKVIKVKSTDSQNNTISKAIEKWKAENNSENTIIEISDNEVYEEKDLVLDLPENRTIIIRSAAGYRPVIRMKNPMKVQGERDSNFLFSGVILDTSVEPISSHCIFYIKKGDIRNIGFDHCTLVPSRNINDSQRFLFSWDNINNDNKTSQDFNNLKNFLIQTFDLKWLDAPSSPSNLNVQNQSSSNNNNNNNKKITITQSDNTNNSLSIEINNDSTFASLISSSSVDNNPTTPPPQPQKLYDFIVRKELEHLRIFTNKVSIYLQAGNDDLKISVSKSITGQILLMNSRASVDIKDSIIDEKYALNCLKCFDLRVRDSTIFGKTSASIMSSASNTIFMDLVSVSRRQLGCARFCYFAAKSVLPKHYKCMNSDSTSNNNIMIYFTSNNYGDPGYGQLGRLTSKEILEGGDYENEIGAFKHLEQVKRIRNLEISLKEFMRFGMDVGIHWEN